MARAPKSGAAVLGGPVTGIGLAAFTAMVALFGIFFDASVGHALTWDNDPYWTYWVTKTFLIATVFGLGTAFFGIGLVRGAVITAVHTVILTVYYWTLSPIGLPGLPDWLDLNHTWITGVPVHFGVIYLGYITAVWLWRRRPVVALETQASAMEIGIQALVAGVAIVLVAGLGATVMLGLFPGLTWFVARLLLTIPFLIAWWAIAGRTLLSSAVGAVVLALIWVAYGHFLGPIGLPGLPLRIFNPASPPAPVRFLDFQELWLVSFPAYVLGSVVVMTLLGRGLRRLSRRAYVAMGVLPLALFMIVAAAPLQSNLGPKGSPAHVQGSGDVQSEAGPYYMGPMSQASGHITIDTVDFGDQVTSLPPHDELHLNASITYQGHTYQVTSNEAMIDDPLGRYTTWWGVSYHRDHHGNSGIGTSILPPIKADLLAWGLGTVSVDGQTMATGVLVHVMAAQTGLPGKLELDVGDPAVGMVPSLPNGHLRVTWSNYAGSIPGGTSPTPVGALGTPREIVGALILIVLVAVGIALNIGVPAVASATGRRTEP